MITNKLYNKSLSFFSDQLDFVFCPATSYKQSFKVQRKDNTCQAREGLVTSFSNAIAINGSHVVVWLSDVHFLYSCFSLHFYHIELATRILYLF